MLQGHELEYCRLATLSSPVYGLFLSFHPPDQVDSTNRTCPRAFFCCWFWSARVERECFFQQTLLRGRAVGRGTPYREPLTQSSRPLTTPACCIEDGHVLRFIIVCDYII